MNKRNKNEKNKPINPFCPVTTRNLTDFILGLAEH